jgi:predicted acyltransferase
MIDHQGVDHCNQLDSVALSGTQTMTQITNPGSLSSESDMRLASLDAYRGLIMIALAFNGFGLAATAANVLKDHPDSTLWKTIQYQFSHVEWVGCAFWDLIQPSFMFMVGVSMAYSYVKRRERGDAWGTMFGHALGRSIILVFLGIFLISNGQSSTEWSLMNVLTQIGLGYGLLFLMWRKAWWVQGLFVAVLLAGTWAAYHYYPSAPLDLQAGDVDRGVSADWARVHLANVPAAWQKNNNLGHAIDVWLLNCLPLKEEFRFSRGGYQTINFIPSLATMLLGLMAGELLRTNASHARKFWLLVLMGGVGIGLGWLWHQQGCPIIKRLWTPSWALFATGICACILAGLVGVIDWIGLRAWSFPLVVVGMNSIAIYVMGMLLRPWTARTLRTHFGQDLFSMFGETYAPLVQMNLVGLCFWLACYWMYRQKIFIRI